MEDLHIMVLIVLVIMAIGYIYIICGQYCENNEYMKNIVRPYIIRRSGCGKGRIESFAVSGDAGEYYNTTLSPGQSWLSRNNQNNNLFTLWNSTRHTRNMSWDMRGDVPIMPYYTGLG